MLLVMQFSPTSCHFVPFRSKYLLQHLVPKTPYVPPFMPETKRT
jgi:hypothetical protein